MHRRCATVPCTVLRYVKADRQQPLERSWTRGECPAISPSLNVKACVPLPHTVHCSLILLPRVYAQQPPPQEHGNKAVEGSDLSKVSSADLSVL